MDNVTIRAAAKVNLFLKIINKRPDGYHTIETLFERIGLFDTITLKKARRGIKLKSGAKGLPSSPENLAYRAASLMKAKFARSLGVEIEIEKSIPIGAGFGGGSSDAAAVLIGLNELFEMNLARQRLEGLAKELGADVMFFLSGATWAAGKNRGDAIEEAGSKTKLWHVLVVPPFFVRSKDAYDWIDKNVSKKKTVSLDDMLGFLVKNDAAALGANMHNDLEGAAFEKDNFLKKLKDRLMEFGAKGAAISGSGPALFGITESEREVINLKEKVEYELAANNRNWQVLTIPTLC